MAETGPDDTTETADFSTFKARRPNQAKSAFRVWRGVRLQFVPSAGIILSVAILAAD
jgi:hypothetical protein